MYVAWALTTLFLRSSGHFNTDPAIEQVCWSDAYVSRSILNGNRVLLKIRHAEHAYWNVSFRIVRSIVVLAGPGDEQSLLQHGTTNDSIPVPACLTAFQCPCHPH